MKYGASVIALTCCILYVLRMHTACNAQSSILWGWWFIIIRTAHSVCGHNNALAYCAMTLRPLERILLLIAICHRMIRWTSDADTHQYIEYAWPIFAIAHLRLAVDRKKINHRCIDHHIAILGVLDPFPTYTRIGASNLLLPIHRIYTLIWNHDWLFIHANIKCIIHMKMSFACWFCWLSIFTAVVSERTAWIIRQIC